MAQHGEQVEVTAKVTRVNPIERHAVAQAVHGVGGTL